VANGAANDRLSAPRAILTYNLLRIALFGVCFGVGWVANIPTFPLLLAALLLSGVLSWFILRRQRIAMGVAVEQQVTRSREKIAERTAKEDAYVDAMQTADQAPRAPSTAATGDQPAS
jgi:hypothetical protein